ncbi:MFS transporter [Fusibacter bizertensis]
MVDNKKNGKIHYAWFVLFGACLMIGFGRGGLVNSGALFYSAVAEGLGVGIGQVTLYMSVASLASFIFIPFSGKILAKFDIRVITAFCAILFGGSYAAFGLVHSVVGLYILALPLSFGMVFITQLIGPVLISTWFKKNNGLAVGIMMACSGGFGTFLQPLIGRTIANYGWRSTYIIVGLVVGTIVFLIATFIFKPSPASKGMLPYGADDLSNDLSNKKPSLEGIAAKDALKSGAFALTFLFLMIATAGACLSQQIGTMAISLGYDTSFAGDVMGFYMFGAFIGSISLGFLTDRLGAKYSSIVAMSLGVISMGVLLIGSHNPLIFKIGMFLFGIEAASIATMGALLVTAMFGNKEYSQIFPLLGLSMGLQALLLYLVLDSYMMQFIATHQ